VEETPEFQLDGRKIILIDTPGFDDTDRSEVEVLRLITTFLAGQ
jgi:predicted GTPase